MKYLLSIFLIFGNAAILSAAKWENDDEAVAEITKEVSQDKKALKSSPPDSEASKAIEQRIDTGLGKLETIGDKHSENPKAQAVIAQAFLSVGEPARALPRAERAVALAPEDPKALVLRGQIKHKLRDYQGAAEDARAALKRDPKNREAFGLFKLSQGRFDSPELPKAPPPQNAQPASPPAAAAYILSDANKAKAENYARQSSQKMKLGDPDAALELAERSIALNSRNGEAYLARAAAKQALKNNAGALADAALALSFGAEPQAAYKLRAQSKAAAGYPLEEVKADFKAAGGLEAEFDDFYNQALSRFGAGGASAQDAAAKKSEPLFKGRAADWLFGPTLEARKQRSLWLILLAAITAACLWAWTRLSSRPL